MIKLILFILTSLLMLTSCRTSNLFIDKKASNSVEDLDSVFYKNNKYEYHIRKDDKITISLWGQDELSVGSTYGIYNSNEVYGKWLLVDAHGNVEIPKIGTFNVEKMTIITLKDTLKERYKEWIKNPVIDIKVLNREITVLGEVIDPQVINIDKERNTLLDMVARCKGFDAYANLKYIKVFRQVNEDVYVANINLEENENHLMKNINLYPGDVVIVPSKKYKEFDKRISTIIPFTTTLTAAAIFMGAF
ncbi:polysaccharide biosynthesis/export family protein [Brumimicrobium mesophilum]|uniref:polysaccharide biosynthesis/export family protein n=1 Tax=Brumimicrobium mesophilum TaxID=392717 RepID=UPI000D1428A7|nr:polysaccharide biosynthesis/export family protein [Brumimicrobium mesophilum]